MNRLLSHGTRGLALLGSASPALAHFTSPTTPHWHASDGWGLLALVALMAGAVWFDRRGR
jgi:hypothetical protein